jgi:DNA topoisomerase-1
VWIAPTANAHLQVTGRDQKGRKQYRYHDDWTTAKAETKFNRLADFGRQLPKIRRQIDADLRKRGLPKAKIVAVALHLLDATHIRVGSEEYARDNGSFGLTTLRNKHAEIEGATIRLTFNGKGGKRWCVDYRDERTARVMRSCQDLPGQRLFQYEDEDGQLQPVHSEDINAWLAEVTGGGFTAKDFRTWSGSVIAAACLSSGKLPESLNAKHSFIVAAVDEVASVLGNTRAVCRASYIHPDVIEAFSSGKLAAVDLRKVGLSAADTKLLDSDERFLLALLNSNSGE